MRPEPRFLNRAPAFPPEAPAALPCIWGSHPPGFVLFRFVFSVWHTFRSVRGRTPEAFLESHPSSASLIMPGRVASPWGLALRQRVTPALVARDPPPPRWLRPHLSLPLRPPWRGVSFASTLNPRVPLCFSGPLAGNTAGAESPPGRDPRASLGACGPCQVIATRS